MNNFRRVLLKLSGESLMGAKQYGIDNDRLADYAQDIEAAVKRGIQVAIVIGGGNIFRGLSGAAQGFDRVQGDQMGMLATVIKGTRVDGIYTADPEKDPTATKFDRITYDEIYQRGLKVMDLTATTMCMENNLPIIVFDMDTPGNLLKVLSGEPIGTYVGF